MSKLLVNSTCGAQEIIEVGDGGSYFDLARVLWDERLDGPLPAGITLGGMVRQGDALVFDQAVYDAWSVAMLEPSLASAIAAADRKAKTVRDAVVANISAAEMASWPIKRAEALAYQASSNTADAPALALEAQARGIALTDLVTKVLDKASALSALEAAIAGRCGALQDAARAAAALPVAADALMALAAIDIDAGWPA